MHNIFRFLAKVHQLYSAVLCMMEQAVLKEILAVPVQLGVDMLKLASSSNESANKDKIMCHNFFQWI